MSTRPNCNTPGSRQRCEFLLELEYVTEFGGTVGIGHEDLFAPGTENSQSDGTSFASVLVQGQHPDSVYGALFYIAKQNAHI